MARNYKRDAKGRFASSGSSRSKSGRGSGRSSKKDGDAIRADIISRFDKLLATPPAGGPPGRAANSIRKTKARLADDDVQSDRRWARRETRRLNQEQGRLKGELGRLQEQRNSRGASSSVAGLKAKRDQAASRVKDATKKIAASKARSAELKRQLEASKARLGGQKPSARRSRRKAS